ncbi:hypothetical protein GEMRC1_000350 [Eukaryota sp. GEM-RC1]
MVQNAPIFSPFLSFVALDNPQEYGIIYSKSFEQSSLLHHSFSSERNGFICCYQKTYMLAIKWIIQQLSDHDRYLPHVMTMDGRSVHRYTNVPASGHDVLRDVLPPVGAFSGLVTACPEVTDLFPRPRSPPIVAPPRKSLPAAKAKGQRQKANSDGITCTWVIHHSPSQSFLSRINTYCNPGECSDTELCIEFEQSDVEPLQSLPPLLDFSPHIKSQECGCEKTKLRFFYSI